MPRPQCDFPHCHGIAGWSRDPAGDRQARAGGGVCAIRREIAQSRAQPAAPREESVARCDRRAGDPPACHPGGQGTSTADAPSGAGRSPPSSRGARRGHRSRSGHLRSSAVDSFLLSGPRPPGRPIRARWAHRILRPCREAERSPRIAPSLAATRGASAAGRAEATKLGTVAHGPGTGRLIVTGGNRRRTGRAGSRGPRRLPRG